METNGGREFKIPLISTNELEAKSLAYNSQEDGAEEETSLPALTNELIEAQHSQCAKIAAGQKNLTALKVRTRGKSAQAFYTRSQSGMPSADSPAWPKGSSDSPSPLARGPLGRVWLRETIYLT